MGVVAPGEKKVSNIDVIMMRTEKEGQVISTAP